MESNRLYNRAYLDFKKFKHEILIDTNEYLENSSLGVVTDTIFHIGTNELHHMVKYYQKIILNSLFFQDKKMLIEYNRWLYRVYFNRGIDLEFFHILNEAIKKISRKYIDHKVLITIDELLDFIIDQHQFFKEQAPRKQILLEYENEATLLVEYLVTNNKQAILETFCSAIKTLDDFFHFYDKIVFNGMKKIGFLWEQGDVSIAKEHISSNLLDDILTHLLEQFPVQKNKNKHIFLSSAPDELHSLGVKIASLVFEKLGYKVTSLGVNIPAKEIRKAIREFQPDYVLFAATLQSSIIDIALLIDELEKDRDSYSRPFQIGIAGNGFEKLIHPAKTVKASFYISQLEDFKLLL
jgi:MerR family transcriptional regulator, light-induced transcriptional regulator